MSQAFTGHALVITGTERPQTGVVFCLTENDTMKARGLAILLCVGVNTAASATTLPPLRDEPVVRAAAIPAMPSPAVTRPERDYFQAPGQNEVPLQTSCRLTSQSRFDLITRCE